MAATKLGVQNVLSLLGLGLQDGCHYNGKPLYRVLPYYRGDVMSIVVDQCSLFSSPTDPTLTLTSLTQLLGSVEDWYLFSVWLDIPRSVYRKHSDEPQRLCEWYLTHHPAPSWLQVAAALYRRGEHDILEVLRSQVHYLKGGSHE